MKNLNFPRLLLAFLVIASVYSCRHDSPPVNPNDKLLLAEYRTQTQYIDDGYDETVNQTYSYGPRQGNFFFSCKPILSINFVDYGGSYNYTYENNRPATLVDNGNPGNDQGLWKFYYDNNNRIIKTGLAYQVAAAPAVFDFFDYDARGNVEYAYRGVTKENPTYYMKYLYNNANKLTGTEFYTKIPAAKNASSTSLALPGYQMSVYTTISSDNKRNPFKQQGRILFFHSNSGKAPFRGNLADSYIALMDNNPLEVIYHYVLSGDDIITHTFNYTYNNKKYPVTNTEIISDPGYRGIGNVSRSTQFTYINN